MSDQVMPLSPVSGQNDRGDALVADDSVSVASRRSQDDVLTPKLGSRKPSASLYLPDRKMPVSPPSPAKLVKPLPTAPLPRPKHPSKCPLFCCFYAEFDNTVGPKICFQSPHGFMDQEIELPIEGVHEILAETFKAIRDGSTPTAPEAVTPKSVTDAVADNTIFNSCSEFIITGNELTGNILNLSTHQIHVLTRPTSITDERYERNSLLFCVGFVLRRTEDPRPFRPVLSKLATTLRDMEVESHFLSNPKTRPSLQSFLERLFVSLNSKTWECNLALNSANVLNLKLFHPPKSPAKAVPEFAVPILLRRDRHVNMYDWDLSINWVSLHVDGVTTARQISEKAEVDMEMVLSCLRVLRHHGVIALVDSFFFSNRYESTAKATAMLAGKEPELLQAAAEFTAHRPLTSLHTYTSDLSPSIHSQQSPGNDRTALDHHVLGDGREMHTLGSYRIASLASNNSHEIPSPRREDLLELKVALAELYAACTRSGSVGDLWVSLLSREHARVDWKKMFEQIDHRRFATFGLVHGLLRRIHNYPMVVEARMTDEEKQLLSSIDVEPIPAARDRPRTGSHRHAAPAPVDHRKLTLKVAGKMDGSRCDDELVSMFGNPFAELLELVAKRQVVSTYAPGSHY